MVLLQIGWPKGRACNRSALGRYATAYSLPIDLSISATPNRYQNRLYSAQTSGIRSRAECTPGYIDYLRLDLFRLLPPGARLIFYRRGYCNRPYILSALPAH